MDPEVNTTHPGKQEHHKDNMHQRYCGIVHQPRQWPTYTRCVAAVEKE